MPKRYYSTSLSIDELFSSAADEYLSLVSAYNANEFLGDQKTAVLDRISSARVIAEKTAQGIKKVFSCYEKSDHGSAQNAFNDIMALLKDSVFISTIDDWTVVKCGDRGYRVHIRKAKEYTLYRIRPVEHQVERIQNDADELFHIPRTKRAYASNARFSLAGFPCLYLSTMLPLAWQECKYPKSFYYSIYQYEWSSQSDYIDIRNEMRFLSLYSPQELLLWGLSAKFNDFPLWLEVVSRYLEAYPLIMACAFVNRSGDTSFKEEYIIPQMLMQWVHRNTETAQGITYFTCADIHNMPLKWNGYNVAIPAMVPFDENGYSEPLRAKFCWSRPQYYECPITVKQKSSEDREQLNKFIDDVRQLSSQYHLPYRMDEYIGELHDISCSMISLLEHGDSIHMEVAIQTIRRINLDAQRAKTVNVSKLISDVQSSNAYDAKAAVDVEDEFLRLSNTFTGLREHNNSISVIIDKWNSIMWNDSLPSSCIMVYYMEENEIRDSLSVLHDNHYLHFTCKIERDSSGVNTIAEMVKKAGGSIDSLWKDGPARELTVYNLEDLNFPIFLRRSNYGHSPDSIAPTYEFIMAGDDKNWLMKNIKRVIEHG